MKQTEDPPGLQQLLPVQTTNQERTKAEMLLLIDGNLLSLQFFFPRVILKKQFHYRKKDKQPQERHGSYLLRAQAITIYEISFSPGHHPKTSLSFTDKENEA